MKNITIKDVAKKLNVSISTISRAFNDKYDIHPDTRKRILQAAEEMGYSPNPIARNLSQKRSYLIGVVVPEFINAFFPKVIKGMQKVLKEAGYQLLIMSSNEQAKEEIENIKLLERNKVDGIMLSLTQEMQDISYYEELNKSIPIVQFNRVSQKLDTPKVIFNDYIWAFQATEYLIKEGYKRLYHLSGPSNLIVSHHRRKAFIDALKKHNLEFNNSQIIETGIFLEDGIIAVDKILDNSIKPDAIFCFNDPIAIGVIEELKRRNIKIPDDIAVMGFTESRIAEYSNPKLSSVEQPSEEMGQITAKVLLEKLKNDTHSSQTISLDGKINIRESTIKCNHNESEDIKTTLYYSEN